ncbi:hypothetical protein [Chamaesiphon sp. VAR_69_metabat_338]|uniref:hypothetical protein n=1 Tax=Chamaesiphon sp. VAR_69_metabat_338 TaxID=2964704 RepID=UPI00286DC3F5|nr:hypothetical protein [Chamaesiphon sp. VAR_69_metabat_338]
MSVHSDGTAIGLQIFLAHSPIAFSPVRSPQPRSILYQEHRAGFLHMRSAKFQIVPLYNS